VGASQSRDDTWAEVVERHDRETHWKRKTVTKADGTVVKDFAGPIDEGQGPPASWAISGRLSLYHRTTAAVAEAVLNAGFIDGKGQYLTAAMHRGVWLSNRPLNSSEGADGDTLLEVSVPPAAVATHEWVEDGKPYREWLVPAEALQKSAWVRIVNG
jgi:hypothetical protein